MGSRAHLSKIHPVVHAALVKAGIELTEVDAVAYTLGPGLQPLHVGTFYAKALAWAADIPAIPVHHMRAPFWRTCWSRDHLPQVSILVPDGQWRAHPARAREVPKQHGSAWSNPGRCGWRGV